MTQPGADDAGTLEVSVVAQLRGFATDLRRKVDAAAARVKASVDAVADTTKFKTDVVAAARAASKWAKAKIEADVDFKKANKSLKDFTNAFGKALSVASMVMFKTLLFGAIGGGLSLLAAGAASAALKLVQFVGALAPAINVALLAPAAIGAVVGVFAAFKIALSGVGDALKETFSAYSTLAAGGKLTAGEQQKLNESLKNLAPSARQFVMEISKLAPAFRALRLNVQQDFFEGIGVAVGKLAKSYLPTLQTGLIGIATMISGGLRSSIDVLNKQVNTLAIEKILNNSALGAGALAAALGPVITAFLALADVGSGYLAGLAFWITKAATQFATFIATAKESGQLGQWIENGLSALAGLATILYELGRVIGSVFAAAKAAGGDAVLGNVIQLARAMADWASSAEGQQALITMFESLNQIGAALGPVVTALADAFATGLVPAIAAIALALAPFALQLVEQVGPALKELTPQLGPLAVAFGQLANSALKIVIDLLKILLPVITDVMSVIAENPGSIYALVGAFAAFKAVLVVDKLLSFAEGLGILKKATVATKVAQMAAAVGAGIWAAAQWVLNLSLWAFPGTWIVLAIIAILAVIFLLWTHSDGFRKFFIDLWDKIWTFMKGVGAWFAGPFADFFVHLWDAIVNGVKAAWHWLQDTFNAGVAFLASIPGRIMAFLAALPYMIGFMIGQVINFWLMLPGRIWDILVLLWTFISTVFTAGATWLIGFVLLVVDSVVDFFFNLPVRVWAALVALWTIITTAFVDGWNWLTTNVPKMIDAVVDFFDKLPRRVWAGIVAVGSFIATAFTTARDWLTTNVPKMIDAVVDFFHGLPGKARDALIGAWHLLTDWLGGLIGGLKNIGKDIVQGVIDGMGENGKKLVEAAKKLLGSIPEPIRKLLGINSPSRVFMEIGRQVVAGFTTGMDKGRDAVTRAATRLGDAALAAAPAASRPATRGTGTGGAFGGLNVEHLEVRAYSERFSLRQVQDELALHAAH